MSAESCSSKEGDKSRWSCTTQGLKGLAKTFSWRVAIKKWKIQCNLASLHLKTLLTNEYIMWKEMKHILPSVIWALHRADMDFYWYNWAERSILVYTGKVPPSKLFSEGVSAHHNQHFQWLRSPLAETLNITVPGRKEALSYVIWYLKHKRGQLEITFKLLTVLANIFYSYSSSPQIFYFLLEAFLRWNTVST